MKAFDELMEVAKILNGPQGCPWDVKQTYASLCPYVLEEANEVLEAVDQGDIKNLIEELGDLLYTVIFYAKIGEKNQDFDINEILNTVKEKLIRRHPHVFGEEKAETPEEVLVHWNRIKAEEKAGRALLEGIPKSLSIVLKAQKIIKRLERHSGPVEVEGEGIGPALLRLIVKAHREGVDAESALRACLNDEVAKRLNPSSPS